MTHEQEKINFDRGLEVYAISSGAYPRIGKNSAGHELRKIISMHLKRCAAREEVSALEDRVACEVLAEQKNMGLDIITDGLIRWYCPISHIAGRMHGVSEGALHHFLDTNFHVKKAVVSELPDWKVPLVADELRFAARQTACPLKAVLTGPATFLRYMVNESHHTRQEIGLAYASALAHEINLIASLEQVAIVHIDDPCILVSDEPWEYLYECYEILYSALHKKKMLEVKTYGAKSSHLLRELLKIPCDYLGLDCVFEKNLVVRLLQSHQVWRGSGKGFSLGIVDARKKIMEDPAMLERSLELLFFYLARPLILEPASGLEFLPRRFAREKCGIVSHTKSCIEKSNFYRDILKAKKAMREV